MILLLDPLTKLDRSMLLKIQERFQERRVSGELFNNLGLFSTTKALVFPNQEPRSSPRNTFHFWISCTFLNDDPHSVPSVVLFGNTTTTVGDPKTKRVGFQFG